MKGQRGSVGMDFQQMVTRASTWVVLAVSAFAPIILWLTATHDRAGHPTSRPALWFVGAFVAGGALAYVGRQWAQRRSATLTRWRQPIDALQLIVFEGLIVVAGVTLGGLASNQWAYSFFLLMFAAVQLPYWFAIGFGLFADVGVVLIVVLSGQSISEHAGALLLALVALPLFAYFAATIALGLQRAQENSESQRLLLRREVDRLSSALGEVAQGDLTAIDDYRRAGERVADSNVDAAAAGAAVDAVWASLDDTLDSVRDLVVQVDAAGEALSGAVAELNAQAAQMAAGSTEQTSAIAETTSAMHELAATAAQIAATAASVHSAADRVSDAGDRARDSVDEAVTSLHEIVRGVDGIADQANLLDESSAEIDRILRVIDELADQTNLLALNAAIEAARAGEHGRGFAVVAGEVRALAERSQQSAAQIQGIVARIRAGTRATVAATAEGAQAAARGARLAEDVQQTLDEMVGAATAAASAAAQIQAATAQQTSASDQVVAAMTQVSSVASQQAAGARSSADAVHGISRLSEQLRSSLAVFQTDG
jgi:methyl-accepting chemotaxis protein